jgi:hypothetical protein
VTWIAEEPITFVYPDGRRVDGRIAIGLPTMVDEHPVQPEHERPGAAGRPA